ncbi:MAG: hypothetical protein ACRDST_14225 [Pseudonocardiaceae bacterium]
MHEALRQSLEPVLRDMGVSGIPVPVVSEDDWAGDPEIASAMLFSRDGSGVGVSVMASGAETDRVARVADQVQEWVIEQLWAQSSTNWPSCPSHPGNHPLSASVIGRVAVWTCPSDGTVFCPVGALAVRKG